MSENNKLLTLLRMEQAFNNISMYLYNKNFLEYAQIFWNEAESKISYIESHSSVNIMSVKSEWGVHIVNTHIFNEILYTDCIYSAIYQEEINRLKHSSTKINNQTKYNRRKPYTAQNNIATNIHIKVRFTNYRFQNQNCLKIQAAKKKKNYDFLEILFAKFYLERGLAFQKTLIDLHFRLDNFLTILILKPRCQ